MLLAQPIRLHAPMILICFFDGTKSEITVINTDRSEDCQPSHGLLYSSKAMTQHMTPEKYSSKLCPAVNPTYINSTDHEAAAACILCVRDSGRPSKCHRAGVVKYLPA